MRLSLMMSIMLLSYVCAGSDACAQVKPNILRELCQELHRQIQAGVAPESTPQFQKIDLMGKAAVSWIVDQVKSNTNLQLRSQYLSLLVHLGNSATTHPLLYLIKSSEQPVALRRQILETAVALKNPRVPILLVEMIATPKIQAIPLGKVFRQINLPAQSPVFPKLFQLFRHREYQVRAKAVSIFLVLRHPHATRHLRTLTRDRSPKVRALVVWALARQGSPRSYGLLRQALSDPSPLVRERAVAGLNYGAYRHTLKFKQLLSIYHKEDKRRRNLLVKWQKLKLKIERLGQNAPVGKNPYHRHRVKQRLVLEQQYLRRERERLHVLLSTLIATLAEIADSKQLIDFLLPLLSHRLDSIAQSAFNALHARREVLRASARKNRIIEKLIVYFGRLQNMPHLWNRLSNLLQTLTEVRCQPLPDFWQRWWEREGKFR